MQEWKRLSCRYTVGYQVYGVLTSLFIKTPKNIFTYAVSQYDKSSTHAMSFNVFVEKEWVSQDKKILNEVESQLFEKLATEPIKEGGTCVYGKFKTWKELIKTKFRGQDVLYDMYCNATAVLKIDLIYKQGKSYHLQTYVE